MLEVLSNRDPVCDVLGRPGTETAGKLASRVATAKETVGILRHSPSRRRREATAPQDERQKSSDFKHDTVHAEEAPLLPSRRPRGFGPSLCGLAALVLFLAGNAVVAQSPGDVDCDGEVGEADRAELTRQVFGQPAPAGCDRADVNRDGQVTVADLSAMFAAPRVTFVGIATDEGVVPPSLGRLEDGTEVFFSDSGTGIRLVVEAVPAVGGSPVGTILLDSAPGHPERRPDLQIQADQPLGGGSTRVCDPRGVPAVAPADFSFTQAISDALNDLACRFQSTDVGANACTLDPLGEPGFVTDGSPTQFCMLVSEAVAFPLGDTRVTAGVRDRAGNVGMTERFVLRIDDGPFPPTFTPRPPTPTEAPTATTTPTPSITPTPTPSGTATRSPTVTLTPPPSATSTITPTPEPAIGPEVLFFGIVGPDNILPSEPPGTTQAGIPVYTLPFGFGFSLVVEVKSGESGRAVGIRSFNETGPPDLQIQSQRPLGDGSAEVCDDMPPIGGVPGVDPPRLGDDAALIDAWNDFGCRFVDGSGETLVRRCTETSACVQDASGEFGCVAEAATDQFCGPISQPLALPPGDTLLTVRVLDQVGNPGPAERLVIRVLND